MRDDSAALVQCNLALPKFAGYIVDTVAHGGGEAELRSAVLAFVGVSIFGAGCTGCRGYLFTARAEDGGRRTARPRGRAEQTKAALHHESLRMAADGSRE